MLTKDEQFELLMGTDVDGILRGKLIPSSKLKPNKTNDYGFCGVIFSWDCMDTVYSSTELPRGLNNNRTHQTRPFDSGRTGYPDIVARVDIDSRRLLSLAQNHSLGPLRVNFVDFLDKGQKGLEFCPRSVLKTAINRLSDHMGLRAECGFELEWYNYKGDACDVLDSSKEPHARAITSGMFGYSVLRPWQNAEYMSDIITYCQGSDVQLDCFHTETGPGVYEAALKHKPALQAADDCQLFKYLAKTIAHHHKITASFMAKPWNGLPGCGGHIHVSLLNASGQNAFANNDDLLGSFVAGILVCLPDLMPFFAPNINSYKRLDLRYWAPVLVGWGEDNRLAVIRIIKVKDDPMATRIEVRVAGADLNPYYALAAIMEAGIYGVKTHLKLPPALDTSNLHPNTDILAEINSRGYAALPSNLHDATHRMLAPNSLARQLFPTGLVEHFGMTRLHEIKVFESSITDWERQRYLELA